jgi:glycerol-3-phosphate acyltransferase PlsY
MIAAEYAAVILVGYLLGAIPFGLLAAKVTRGVDVREYGSGKTGGTNVLRTAGLKAGLFTMVTDLGKGALAAGIAWFVLHSYAAQGAAAMAAVAGHNWPIYARFRGGRGVGPYIGALGAMYWPIALVCSLGIGLGVAALTRYVSLGAIFVAFTTFFSMLTLYLLGMQPVEYMVYTAVGGGLILFQHRDNIQRLLAGTERRIGEQAEKRVVPSAERIKE